MKFQKNASYKILGDISGFVRGIPYTIHAGTIKYIDSRKVGSWFGRLFHKTRWGIFILDNTVEVDIPMDALEGKVEKI